MSCMQHFSIVPNKQRCHAESRRWRTEYRTKSASSLTKEEKPVRNDSGHKLQQLRSFQHLGYPVSRTSLMLFHPSMSTRCLLLHNHVAVLADSHVWNFKLNCNINISRLEQVYAYTNITSQKSRLLPPRLRMVTFPTQRCSNPGKNNSFHIPRLKHAQGLRNLC